MNDVEKHRSHDRRSICLWMTYESYYGQTGAYKYIFHITLNRVNWKSYVKYEHINQRSTAYGSGPARRPLWCGSWHPSVRKSIVQMLGNQDGHGFHQHSRQLRRWQEGMLLALLHSPTTTDTGEQRGCDVAVCKHSYRSLSEGVWMVPHLATILWVAVFLAAICVCSCLEK